MLIMTIYATVPTFHMVKQLLTYSYAEISSHIYTGCNNSSVLQGGKGTVGTVSMNVESLNTFNIHDL